MKYWTILNTLSLEILFLYVKKTKICIFLWRIYRETYRPMGMTSDKKMGWIYKDMYKQTHTQLFSIHWQLNSINIQSGFMTFFVCLSGFPIINFLLKKGKILAFIFKMFVSVSFSLFCVAKWTRCFRKQVKYLIFCC